MQMNSLRSVACAVCAACLALPALAAPQKNVLFYGNSFTLGFGSTRTVNAIFEDIVLAAGHDAPIVQSAAASGQSIGWHLQNNVGPIFTLIPPDQDWDFIVMQEFSTQYTKAFATYPQSIQDSIADVKGLYGFATQRSPNVTPVMYETWARGPGHPFYTGGNPIYPGGPSAMQADIRDGYSQVQAALNAEIGSDLARVAPVGTAWENGNWDDLHATDNWHAGNRGSLLAAMVIYSTIYEDLTLSDIDLSGVLASLNLDAADGAFLVGVAEATVPEPASALALLGLATIVWRRR